MKYQFIICCLFFLTSYASELYQSKAVIIMGASCSGKTTLAKKLLEYLDKNWKLIEFDLIEENIQKIKSSNNRFDEEVIDELINESNQTLTEGYNILIDTNIYAQKLNHIKSIDKKFVFVYCPLVILRKRNKERDIIFKRDEKRIKRAAEYIEETFHAFNSIKHYDIYIDSSLLTIEESCKQITELKL